MVLESLGPRAVENVVTEGLFSGRMLSVADGVAVQRVNRAGDLIRHDAAKLSAVVKEGDVVDIRYSKAGVGVVSGLGKSCVIGR